MIGYPSAAFTAVLALLLPDGLMLFKCLAGYGALCFVLMGLIENAPGD